jgi:hypothetical protein
MAAPCGGCHVRAFAGDGSHMILASAKLKAERLGLSLLMLDELA